MSEQGISLRPTLSLNLVHSADAMSAGEQALATALDNLNAAFGTGAEMPIDDWNVRSLADLAEMGDRNDIADCLRDSLRLIADEQRDAAPKNVG